MAQQKPFKKPVKRYLQHDIDAMDDVKIDSLIDIVGFEAYGLYWHVLERMWALDELSLPYDEITFRAIRRRTGTSLDVRAFIDHCLDLGLFDLDGDMLYSESLVRRFEVIEADAQQRSEQARENVNKRWKKHRERRSTKKSTAVKKVDTESYDRNTTVLQNDTPVYDGNTDRYEAIRNDTNKTRQDKIDKTREDVSSAAPHARACEGDSCSLDFGNPDKTEPVIILAGGSDQAFQSIVETYESEIGIMSRNANDEVSQLYTDGMAADVIIEAIKEASDQGKRSWAYLRAILRGYKDRKVMTVDALKHDRDAYQSRKKTPTAMNGRSSARMSDVDPSDYAASQREYEEVIKNTHFTDEELRQVEL